MMMMMDHGISRLREQTLEYGTGAAASNSHQNRIKKIGVNWKCVLGGSWPVECDFVIFFVVDFSCRRYMLWYVYVHGLGRWK